MFFLSRSIYMSSSKPSKHCSLKCSKCDCFSPEFPTTKLEMTAVADIFDRDGDGYIDYYEFVAALHPNKDAYRPTTDADKIEDEVWEITVF